MLKCPRLKGGPKEAVVLVMKHAREMEKQHQENPGCIIVADIELSEDEEDYDLQLYAYSREDMDEYMSELPEKSRIELQQAISSADEMSKKSGTFTVMYQITCSHGHVLRGLASVYGGHLNDPRVNSPASKGLN